ncbi:MAG: hypothetical protein Q4D61_08785 [Cardiobacteriaceae bacterium]|nr:hypothetical protein [Cardiobacteriaceae bacterium]
MHHNDDDFNPLYPGNHPERHEILDAAPIPLAYRDNNHPDADPVHYTRDEYDKLFRQYDAWKRHAKTLEEGFFALADMMYETLAYLNGTRLYQGKAPLMLTDINAIIENNTILAQLTNDIRHASIASGYGLVSELVESQNHLRNGILADWAEKMQNPELRPSIAEELLDPQDDIDTLRVRGELFDTPPAEPDSDNNPENETP